MNTMNVSNMNINAKPTRTIVALAVSAGTNCGKNAKKNRDNLGFKTFRAKSDQVESLGIFKGLPSEISIAPPSRSIVQAM